MPTDPASSARDPERDREVDPARVADDMSPHARELRPNTRVVGAAPGPRGPRTAPAPTPAPEGPKRSGGAGLVAATVIGFGASVLVAGAIGWVAGCNRDDPPGAADHAAGAGHAPRAKTSSVAAGTAAAPDTKPAASGVANANANDAGAAPEAPAPEEPEKPWDGPMLGALMPQTPIYAKMEFSKKRIGYIRQGSRVPVDPKPVKDDECKQGWYRLIDGGFVCGRHATLDMNDQQLKLGIAKPNLDDVLPYKYANNANHGTPLYRSVPSREEMLKYEPYLEKKKKKDPEADADAGAPSEASASASASGHAAAPAPETLGLLDAGAPVADPEAKPWWQADSVDKSELAKIKLADLEQEADGTVAKRMVRGFYIAIDKTFSWQNRLWYKSTSGLVAPADRMYQIKGPSSKGVDWPEGAKQLGFVAAQKASKYEVDEQAKSVKKTGPATRYQAVALTGASVKIKESTYRQTTEGWWMKSGESTYTDPGPVPELKKPGEKWIDVNLARKTLVLFEGDKPVYAALVSPGKKNKIRAKDHSTVKGSFRIREKHLTATMDGDGTAAGDLPYSIEDVPFVQYFERSYALHAAFWHSQFGYDMSHGCVNLSPLDAKKVFTWSEPRIPRGWHGVWSTDDKPGSLVVVHDGNASDKTADDGEPAGAAEPEPKKKKKKKS